jgi:hypothetical protein
MKFLCSNRRNSLSPVAIHSSSAECASIIFVPESFSVVAVAGHASVISVASHAAIIAIAVLTASASPKVIPIMTWRITGRAWMTRRTASLLHFVSGRSLTSLGRGKCY